jgi:hypothetical protein
LWLSGTSSLLTCRCSGGVLGLVMGKGRDSGNDDKTGTCRTDCTARRCGDSMLDLKDEEWGNDGNGNSTGTRRVGGAIPVCGDGIAGGALLCWLLWLYGASALLARRCSGGILGLGMGEGCDSGNDDEIGKCRSDCTTRRCGHGMLNLEDE